MLPAREAVCAGFNFPPVEAYNNRWRVEHTVSPTPMSKPPCGEPGVNAIPTSLMVSDSALRIFKVRVPPPNEVASSQLGWTSGERANDFWDTVAISIVVD